MRMNSQILPRRRIGGPELDEAPDVWIVTMRRWGNDPHLEAAEGYLRIVQGFPVGKTLVPDCRRVGHGVLLLRIPA